MVILETQTIDLCNFVNDIRKYEPNLVRIIFDFVFVPCFEDKEGKHKYIRAIPKLGTNYIDEYSFYSNTMVRWVIIDKSVKNINSYAFKNCSSLETITIGYFVRIIGYRAFMNCLSLNSIYIPHHVKAIGSFAFVGCAYLTNVYISRYLKLI